MKLHYVTTYEPSHETLGGASWVDRHIISTFASQFDVAISSVSNKDGSDGHVKLEVRGDKSAAARTILRMIRHSEPYFSAKLRSDRNWNGRGRDISSRIVGEPSIVVTSQLPALLLLLDHGIKVDLHIAHNVDAVLAREYDPLPFRILRNSLRTEAMEKNVLRLPTSVAALSIRDVERLRSWGIESSHWKLAGGSTTSTRRTGRIGFLGKGTWPPNIAAIDYLTERVMPLVKNAMGEAAPTVVVGGRGTSRWDSYPGVEVVGEVESAADFYGSVDVVVVPRMGSATGISVKMLEAISSGVPVIVPEQLAADAGLENGYYAAGSAEETADRIVRYYTADPGVTVRDYVEERGVETGLPECVAQLLLDRDRGPLTGDER
ncbi:glycosyltransferase family 4 protein [Rhodococcus sp. NPDC056960]|uniref:glycosyltransferase family 4 protein n=1 Tax=Rhodococcus sp. NPDC056960 TaxID=3345982 RepID=UPI003638A16F